MNHPLFPPASYRYRRDYAAVADCAWALRRLEPLPLADAGGGAFASRTRAGGSQAAALDPPDLSRDIAWELVLRDLREAEVRGGGGIFHGFEKQTRLSQAAA